MRNIYKDEVIGDINSNLIYNNEIKGIFGELTALIESTGTLMQHNALGTYKINLMNYVNPPPSGEQGTARRVYEYIAHPANTHFTFNFNSPIKVQPADISINLSFNIFSAHREELRQTSTSKPQWFLDFSQFASENLMWGTATEEFKVMPSTIQQWFSYIGTPTSLEITQPIQPTNIKIAPFSISFDIPPEIPIKPFYQTQVALTTEYAWTYYGWYPSGNQYLFYATPIFFVMQSITINIQGKTFVETPHAFQYGSKGNALEQPQSTLLTTNSTYKGQPLWEHIGQRITNQWYNGKQVVTLPVIINDESDIRTVDEEVYILNVRRGEIDENNQNEINNASIFKTLDGRAKKFIIVNVTYNYDGSFNQLLDLQEVI